MDLTIRQMNNSDIQDVSLLVKKTWYKHKFFDLGFEFDKITVIKKLIEYIASPVHFVFVAIVDDVIRGYLILVEAESVFSSQRLIIQIAIQSDPEIGKYQESILVKKLMNFTDKFVEGKDYHLQCMTMSHTHDFSNHLKKHGYALSDKIFTRRVN